MKTIGRSIYGILFFSILLVPNQFFGQEAVTPNVPELEDIIPVHIHTIPVQLKRIYRPDIELPPTGNGLYIERIKESSIFYKNGLRSGMVIRGINNERISSRSELVYSLSRNLNEIIELSLWDPSSLDNFSNVSFRYEHKNQTVTSFRNAPLYHDPSQEHSPRTESNPTYNTQFEAKVDGRRPCPVCFPGSGSSIWNEVLVRGLGPTNKFVKQLIKKHGRANSISDFLRSAFRNITKHRLRYQVKPRLIVLDSRRLFASGTPDGTVVLSKGILEFAEGLHQKRLLIAHMLAHVDGRHPPRSVRFQQATNILQRGVKRVSNVGVGLKDIGDFLFNTFGFTFQRRWRGLGYDDEHEREAHFLKYYYLHKVGVPFEVEERWDIKRRDLIRNLNEKWANYLVLHPSVETENDEERWKRQIRSEIRSDTS